MTQPTISREDLQTLAARELEHLVDIASELEGAEPSAYVPKDNTEILDALAKIDARVARVRDLVHHLNATMPEPA